MSVTLEGDEAATFVEFVEQLDDKWNAPNQYGWSIPQIARFVSGDPSLDVNHYSVTSKAGRNAERLVTIDKR